MGLASMLRELGRRTGHDVVPYGPSTSAELRRAIMLREEGIDLVLDVNANSGYYVQRLVRRQGYTGRVVSFEPLPDAFARLARTAEADPAWECRPVALGASDRRVALEVANDVVSSSVLALLSGDPSTSSPGGRAVEVTVCRLDTLREQLRLADHRCHLNLDVEGRESEVLEGAERSLEHIRLLELELSLAPRYAGQPLLCETVAALGRLGFRLVALEARDADQRTGHVRHLDGVFRHE